MLFYTAILSLYTLLTAFAALFRKKYSGSHTSLYDNSHCDDPIEAEDHQYHKEEGASRSPCPALNALANHGYLPRSGTKIHFRQLARALHDVYHLSYPLSAFLASAAFVALGQFSDLSLGDLCRHNHIEHDASLAHRDAAPEQEYAPCKCSRGMLERLLSFSSDGKHLTVGDAARARAARERQYARPLDGVHAEIARGEVALVLGIFGGPEQEVPLDVLRTWWRDETFPTGWRPTGRQSFFKTVFTAWKIRRHMNEIGLAGSR